MKILLVAHDMAPSRCFAVLSEALRGAGHDVQLIVGNGQYPTIQEYELKSAVQWANFMLVGMSSSSEFARLEMAACMYAKEYGLRYGFYSDTPFVINRAHSDMWFGPYADDANLVVGLMGEQAASIFYNARIVRTGNPLREAMSFPQFSRNDTRQKLGVSEKNVLVHVAGGKYCAVNCATLLLVDQAISNTISPNWRVVFTPHPGDPTFESSSYIPREYAEICKHASTEMKVVVQDVMSSSEVLSGADVVIEYTGSTSLEAVYHRIPVVSIQLSHSRRYYESEGGTFPMELTGTGAALSVSPNPRTLGERLTEVTTPGNRIRQGLIALQQGHYPLLTERGVAIATMVDAINRHHNF